MARTTTLVTCPSALYAPCGGKCGGQQVTIRNYTVALPTDAPEIRVNDEVVVATAGDPRLPNESLWVHDVRFGSQIWERDLVCANVPPAQI